MGLGLFQRRSFPPAAASVRAARHFTLDAVRAARGGELPAAQGEALALLVTEVVTNAVCFAPDGEFEVEVRCSKAPEDSSGAPPVHVEVVDTGTELPRPRRPDDSGEHGRGLLLLHGLAARWGVTNLDKGRKVVWFEL